MKIELRSLCVGFCFFCCLHILISFLSRGSCSFALAHIFQCWWKNCSTYLEWKWLLVLYFYLISYENKRSKLRLFILKLPSFWLVSKYHMCSTDTDVIDSYIRLMTSPYLKFSLIRINYDDVNLSHCIFLISDGLQYDERNIIWRFLVLNHFPHFSSIFENIWICCFAKLAFKWFERESCSLTAVWK